MDLDRHICSTAAFVFFSPSQWQIPEVLSHTHALPSPVTNWICTSVYLLDWDLTMTFSERNKSKHVFESLWVLCNSVQWSRLPGPAVTGAVTREICLFVVASPSKGIFLPGQKISGQFIVEVWTSWRLRACTFAGTMSHCVPICLSLLIGRTGCRAAPHLEEQLGL